MYIAIAATIRAGVGSVGRCVLEPGSNKHGRCVFYTSRAGVGPVRALYWPFLTYCTNFNEMKTPVVMV